MRYESKREIRALFLPFFCRPRLMIVRPLKKKRNFNKSFIIIETIYTQNSLNEHLLTLQNVQSVVY